MSGIPVVYWSGTGNTAAMAEAVAKGIGSAGKEAELIEAASFDAADVSKYDAIAFGCPAMGDEELEEDFMEPLFSACEDKIRGKRIALFGSYDWGDGEWMRTWEDRVSNAGGEMVADGVIANNEPGDDELRACEDLGVRIAQ